MALILLICPTNTFSFVAQTIMYYSNQILQSKGWYGNDSVRCAISQLHLNDTVLADAFTESKQIFEDALCQNEDDKAWIASQASIKDVVQAVGDARDAYHAHRSSKAWKWLTQFSSRNTYYSSVLDVMVQHHPEYASLAWGAMKMLFVAVTKLYAHIIHFMVRTLRWYQKSKAKRAIGALFKPSALNFQDNLTEVNELSRDVDEIATTAAQAELRAVHVGVMDTNHMLSLARSEIKRLSDLVSLQADRLLQVASCTNSISSQIQLDVRAQATMNRTVQLNQIMTAPFMKDLPSSGASLKYCSIFARRQPQTITLSQTEIDLLHCCSVDNDIFYTSNETLYYNYT
ncbi:hypothetical protein B0O99DRAFT_600563 [Bisporella sp. PMI_857]|nr:hypothetical protein B0O99DRAFT_600563 [Bisporella sp. PMI_857]